MEDSNLVELIVGGEVVAKLHRSHLNKYFKQITIEQKQCNLDKWFDGELQITAQDLMSYIKAIMQEGMNDVLNLTWPKVDEIWFVVESMGVKTAIHNSNELLVQHYTDYLSKKCFESVVEMGVALSTAKSKLGNEILMDILTPIAKATTKFRDQLDRNMHLINPSINRPLKQVQDAFVKYWSWISVKDNESQKYEMDFNDNFKSKSMAAMVKLLPSAWVLNHVGNDLQKIGKNMTTGEYRIGYRLKRVINAIWDRVYKDLGRFGVTDNISSSVEVEVILLRIESMDKENNLAENWEAILNAIDSVRKTLPLHNLEQLFLGITECPPGIQYYGESIISMMEPFWTQKNKHDNVNNDWTVAEQWCTMIEKLYSDDSETIVEKLLTLWDSLTPVNKFYFGLSVAEYYVFDVKYDKFFPPQRVVDRLNKHCFKQNWFVVS